MLDIEGSLEQILAGKVLDAFSSVTFSLPEELQLTYQLHLEGLLPSEIARITETKISEIELLIGQAKELLGSGYNKLRETA